MTTPTTDDPFAPVAVESFTTSAARIDPSTVPDSVVKLVKQAYAARMGAKVTFRDASTAESFARYARAWASGQEPRLTFRVIPALEDDSDGTIRFAVSDFKPRGRAGRKAKEATATDGDSAPKPTPPAAKTDAKPAAK